MDIGARFFSLALIALVCNASVGKVLICFQLSPSSSISSPMPIDSFDLQIMHTCIMNENCDEGLHCETCIANGNVWPRCTRIKPIDPLTKAFIADF